MKNKLVALLLIMLFACSCARGEEVEGDASIEQGNANNGGLQQYCFPKGMQKYSLTLMANKEMQEYYRYIKLAPKECYPISSLSFPGYYTLIVIGNRWCPSCELLEKEVVKLLSEYERLAFVYIDLSDSPYIKDIEKRKNDQTFCLYEDNKIAFPAGILVTPVGRTKSMKYGFDPIYDELVAQLHAHTQFRPVLSFYNEKLLINQMSANDHLAELLEFIAKNTEPVGQQSE